MKRTQLRRMLTVVIRVVAVLTLLLPGSVFFDARTIAPAIAQSPDILVSGTVPVEDAVKDAVRLTLTENALVEQGRSYAITDVTERDGWLFVSVAGLKGLGEDLQWNLLDHAVSFDLIILQHTAQGRWDGALEGTEEYSNLLEQMPEKLLSSKAKHDLASRQSPQSSLSGSYRFPWPTGTSMYYGTLGLSPVSE